MRITLQRFSAGDESTLGLLFIDGHFICYTLEDEKRTKKVYAETRIPSGKYLLEVREYGGHHERYSKKYPAIHQGMIQLVNVPGFTDVLVHIGNDDDDTAGCILVGNQQVENISQSGKLIDSTSAYLKFYSIVIDSVINGNCYLEIKEESELVI